MDTPEAPRAEAAYPVAFLTSFSPDLLQATGRTLLGSYLACKIDAPLYVCHEPKGGIMPDFAPWGIKHVYNLDQDEFLRRWLDDNKDIIPRHLGGLAKECTCPDRKRMHGTHKRGCHYQWMNRNASRWFRKVVCWRYAAKRIDARMVVWVDSDSVFRRPMPVARVEALFGAASVFYCRGRREAPETGVIGFHFEREGRRFIADLCDYYLNKEFRTEERWDDGYIVGRRVVEGAVLCRDVVSMREQVGNEAIQYTPLRDYITHNKGSHGRKMGVMR